MKIKRGRDKSTLSVEEFMLDDSNDDSDGEEQVIKKRNSTKRKSQNIKLKENDNIQTASSHKKSLQQLKVKDPEFYDFLKNNDEELLNFSGSSGEDSDEEQTVHIPPDKLEVDSDQSDGEEDKGSSNIVTLAVIDEWSASIDNRDNVTAVVHEIVEAFKAAVNEALGEHDKSVSRYVVKGHNVFNAVCRLCVLKLSQAIRISLNIKDDDRNPNIPKCKRWKKIRVYLSSYIGDLIKVLNSMNDPSLLSVMLKHIHSLLKYISCLDKGVRSLLKVLINLWSTSDETVRVLSFMCILKLTRMDQSNRLEQVLKLMYLTYVKNVKFTSSNTWPAINFLRKSLVEMFGLDPRLSYQHAFMYIRQLAIHLRTALTINKKENIQAVSNWQYMHCLYLWGDLLGSFPNSPALSPLVYPLVQVTIGVIRLVPSVTYLPLRFHCVRMLTKLSYQCHSFIPILPFIYETLDMVNLNKKYTVSSIKPFEFRCLIRLSNQQLQESALKDSFVNEVYELLMEYLNGVSHSIGFPELILPLTAKLKAFLKSCKSPNHCKKMKQLLEKIQENCIFIEERRLGVNFELFADSSISNWENECSQVPPPLCAYYLSWRQVRNKELILGDNKKSEELELPTIQRHKFSKKTDNKQEELFPSDEDDEPTLLEKEQDRGVKSVKRKQKKLNVSKKPKRQKLAIDSIKNNDDIVEDLELSEDDE